MQILAFGETNPMSGWRLKRFVKAENLRVTLTTQGRVEFSLLDAKYLRIDMAN